MDGAEGEQAVELVLALASQLMTMTDRPVLGVGVGSPGVVDAHGTVVDAPNLAWTDTPLAARLAGTLDVPVFVANDANTASAPGYAVAALHAGYVRRWERWEFNAFARIDNLFDRRVIGSVIVNEGNARYFEPAPGRIWTAGLGAAYRF